MRTYFYFWGVCFATAVGLIIGTLVDSAMEMSKRGMHEKRGAK